MLVAWIPIAAAVELVDGERARRLVDDGAVVLDARSWTSFWWSHVPGAVAVDWRIGVVGGLRSGLLGPPDEVAARFGELGVTNDLPVLVVGAWTDGWGEEGRIAWDLAYLGHTGVHVLRGGMPAWDGAVERGPTRPTPRTFVAALRAELRADRAELRAAPVVLDVREPDEYAGSNEHLAAYGGHVPGATSLPWRSLVDGATPPPAAGPIVVYCTGGVRSGFAWMWLSAHGYTVANADGGWWDWAAHEPREP